MSFPKLSGTLAAALLLLAGWAAPAAGQSLFAGRGLGLVVQPRDARMHGLGGVALGLPGNSVSWVNPASAVGLVAPSLQVGYQFDDFSADFGGRSANGTTARFPLIQIATPFGERWAFNVGYGAFLDQNWAVEQTDTLLIGADTFTVLDRAASNGGVSRLRAGAGYRVLDGLAVGLGADLYTGSLQVQSGRRFPDAATRCCTAEWNYGGVGYNGGLTWQPGEAFTLAAAASVGGTLEAEGQDSLAESSTYDLPAMLMVGASARVAGNTLLAASADWAGWSSLDAELSPTGGARDSWSVQGGLEWDGLQIGERPVPIRLGGRYAALPFQWGNGEGEEWAEERAFTGGLGIVLAGGAATTDLAFETGVRGGADAGIEESFWRLVVSLTVLGR